MNRYSRKNMTIYYAHPMSWYGTDLEARDLEYLRSEFKAVINPNDPIVERDVQLIKAQRGDVMAYFADIVHLSDGVVFRTFADGKLGSGVGREVFEAKIAGKHIDRIIGGVSDIGFAGNNVRHLIPAESMTSFNHLLTLEETKRRVREGKL